MIIRRIPWTVQPQIPVGVNWGAPICKKLLTLVPFCGAGGGVDLVTGKFGTATGLGTVGITINGQYPVFGTSSYYDLPSVPPVGTTSPFTIAWTQEPRSTSAYSTICSINFGTAGSTNAFLIYQAAADANYYFNVGPQGNGAAADTTCIFGSTTGAVTNNALDRYVLRANISALDRTGAGYDLFRNGTKIAGTTGTALNNFGSDRTSQKRIGAIASGGDPFEGLIGNFHVWGRALLDAEAIAWCRNEFITLAPQSRPVFYAPAAAPGGFQAAWARNANSVIQGMRA